jgi:small subunit ribosomal protein S6
MADRRYETLVLIHPDQGEPGAKEIENRIRALIEEQKGTINQVQDWGSRELAYVIDKQRRAFFVLFEYRATSDGLREIERNVKLMDAVIRFISVRRDEDAPLSTFRPARGQEADERAPEEAIPDLDGATDGEGA